MKEGGHADHAVGKNGRQTLCGVCSRVCARALETSTCTAVIFGTYTEDGGAMEAHVKAARDPVRPLLDPSVFGFAVCGTWQQLGCSPARNTYECVSKPSSAEVSGEARICLRRKGAVGRLRSLLSVLLFRDTSNHKSTYTAGRDAESNGASCAKSVLRTWRRKRIEKDVFGRTWHLEPAFPCRVGSLPCVGEKARWLCFCCAGKHTSGWF